MKTFLDKLYSIEEVLPEQELTELPARLSALLRAEIALFDQGGSVLGAWKGGKKLHSATRAKALAKAAAG
ncbi:MAG: hypothetical protein AB1405_16070, partial [Bdellovibrionota bacterium]